MLQSRVMGALWTAGSLRDGVLTPSNIQHWKSMDKPRGCAVQCTSTHQADGPSHGDGGLWKGGFEKGKLQLALRPGQFTCKERKELDIASSAGRSGTGRNGTERA